MIEQAKSQAKSSRPSEKLPQTLRQMTHPTPLSGGDFATGEPLMKTRLLLRAAVGLALIVAAGSTARAQVSLSTSGDDPVSRAMKSVEASISSRADAADLVIVASKLVEASAVARKQGRRERAIEFLKEAQRLASAAGSSRRSALIDGLNSAIRIEMDALAPQTSQAKPAFPSGLVLGAARSQTVRARFAEYRSTLTHILEEEKLPPQLLAVALIESGFNPQALSSKGARGIWQFMPATARRYGLMVGPGEDHRTHPEHSTRAAARYLRDLYNQFGNWKLALAAYNTGENRIQRIINRTGIRDFDEMARRGHLPAETRNYVPAVLAAWARLSKGR